MTEVTSADRSTNSSVWPAAFDTLDVMECELYYTLTSSLYSNCAEGALYIMHE